MFKSKIPFTALSSEHLQKFTSSKEGKLGLLYFYLPDTESHLKLINEVFIDEDLVSAITEYFDPKAVDTSSEDGQKVWAHFHQPQIYNEALTNSITLLNTETGAKMGIYGKKEKDSLLQKLMDFVNISVSGYFPQPNKTAAMRALIFPPSDGS